MRHVARDGSDGDRGTDSSSPERGSALMITMLLVLLMGVLGVTLLSVSVTDRKIAANEAASTRAFGAAEAGIERAIAVLPSQTVNTLLAGGGALYTSVALDTAGTYTTIVSNNFGAPYPTGIVPNDTAGSASVDADGYLVLTATGASGTARRVISTVVRLIDSPIQQALHYALFGNSSTTVGGGGVITGNVGSNGNVSTGSTINGNVSAVGTIGGSGTINGTRTPGAPAQSLPDVNCPAIPFGPAPSGAGVTFNSGTGDVDMSGNSNTTFAAGTYYFRNFSKCCNGFANFPLGGIVKIYISGTMTVAGNGFVNPNGTASSIQVFACGTNSSTWSVGGNNDSWFTVYAPRHPLTFAGNGDKHGAFVGASIAKSGNGNVVYDSTAQQAAPPPTFAKVAHTWRENW